MSRKYKFRNPDGLYFVTFSVINWVDVFTRDIYREIFIENLQWYSQHKGLIIHSWVLMTNHVHLIVSRNSDFNLEEILRDLKKYTAKLILEEISKSSNESRRDWMLRIFREAGRKNSQNKNNQFWQHGNHPIELFSTDIMLQKLDYIHENPVKQGFAINASAYPWSSACDYEGIKGFLEIEML